MRKVLVVGIGMLLMMSLLYVVGFNKTMDKDKIQEIELLMSQLENK